jgi:hypothetical protein
LGWLPDDDEHHDGNRPQQTTKLGRKSAENGGKSGASSLLSSPSQEGETMTEKTKNTTTKALRRNVGEIIQRGRIWYIRYYDGRGRRRLETTKSTTREDAEKLLRKRLSAKDAGVLSKIDFARLVVSMSIVACVEEA